MLLEPSVVGVVQIVQAHDMVPRGQQQFRDFASDEPGCAGDKQVHPSTSTI